MIAVSLLSSSVRAEWKAEIGFIALQKRLGNTMPTGRTIQIAQVEMPSDDDGDYLPDRSDAQLVGKTITGRSGAAGISNHATIVGQYCMGLTSSVGPGIRLIDSYEANNWAGAGLLLVNTDRPPKVETRPVQNHSWIGSFGAEGIDVDALRRIDLVVERDGVLVAAGVKNGSATPVPHLMCSAYNVIAVGVSNGQSSYGPVTIETAGRIKPDIVAPMAATSWATPVVASCGSLLMEAIEAGGDLKYLPAARARPARPLLVKALLMAGASKSVWGDWRRGCRSAVADGSVPLDYRYGAGQINIDRGYRILEGGRQSPSSNSASTGWDCHRASPGRTQRYGFELKAPAPYASVLLTWHRHIAVDGNRPLVLSACLANLDLRLIRLRRGGGEETVDISRSCIDNVEHVYQRALPAGRYVIEVTADRASDYALAWDVPAGVVAPSLLARVSDPP